MPVPAPTLLFIKIFIPSLGAVTAFALMAHLFSGMPAIPPLVGALTVLSMGSSFACCCFCDTCRPRRTPEYRPVV